jgi:hypothetical protein
MLDKQVRGLVTNPDTLCAQVLKAKYYPHGDILKAGPKQGSSYSWQSIVAGLQSLNVDNWTYMESGQWKSNKYMG